MRRLRRWRPSPAMVVACLALFVAGAGTATAAKLITGREIKNNTITSRDVKNRSLMRKDFRSHQLPAGPQGLPGAPGRAGRDGFGVLTYDARFFSLADNEKDSRFAPCPAGQYPTGGDAYAVDGSDKIREDVPIAEFFFIGDDNRPNSWAAEATNNTGGPIDVFIEVICANAAQPPPPIGKVKAKGSTGIREARPVR